MAETFCDSGSVKLKAGANVSTSITAAQYTSLINQAESLINCSTRINYTDTYSGLDSDKKLLLEEVASNVAAIYAIIYDMSGYTSRIEAEDMINVLRDAALRGISLLRDQKTKDFVNAT